MLHPGLRIRVYEEIDRTLSYWSVLFILMSLVVFIVWEVGINIYWSRYLRNEAASFNKSGKAYIKAKEKVEKVKKPKEQSLLLPVLFQKLGQDIWIDDKKMKKCGFQSNSASLAESMAKFGSFIKNNPWYVKQKFSFAL